jgi:crotonobetainyl-CoA:carnitine CoA-transferase CaiB-like acyl-CoA transferase
MTGWSDRNPGLVRGPIDLHAAAFACLGVLSLLRRRMTTGKGGYLDCSAIEAVASTLGVHMIEAQCGLPMPVRNGNGGSGLLINDVFPCAGEDQWLALSLADEDDARVFARVLCDQFGANIALDAVLGGSWDAIAVATQVLDVVALAARLTDAGLACARSTSMLQAMGDTRLSDRRVLQRIQHDTIGEQVVIGLPWMVDGRPYRIGACSPKLGAHNERVAREWLGSASTA